jgi:hypothetical protein
MTFTDLTAKPVSDKGIKTPFPETTLERLGLAASVWRCPRGPRRDVGIPDALSTLTADRPEHGIAADIDEYTGQSCGLTVVRGQAESSILFLSFEADFAGE